MHDGKGQVNSCFHDGRTVRDDALVIMHDGNVYDHTFSMMRRRSVYWNNTEAATGLYETVNRGLDTYQGCRHNLGVKRGWTDLSLHCGQQLHTTVEGEKE